MRAQLNGRLPPTQRIPPEYSKSLWPDFISELRLNVCPSFFKPAVAERRMGEVQAANDVDLESKAGVLDK